MIASCVKVLPGFTGDARLYRCDPPLDGHEYVVVSAVNAMYTGPETYIFPSDPNGRVTDWGEMRGSFRGRLDHEAALTNAGYSVRDGE